MVGEGGGGSSYVFVSAARSVPLPFLIHAWCMCVHACVCVCTSLGKVCPSRCGCMLRCSQWFAGTETINPGPGQGHIWQGEGVPHVYHAIDCRAQVRVSEIGRRWCVWCDVISARQPDACPWTRQCANTFPITSRAYEAWMGCRLALVRTQRMHARCD